MYPFNPLSTSHGPKAQVNIKNVLGGNFLEGGILKLSI